jgi:hypothetical protein
MKTGAPRFLRRSLSLAAAGILAVVLAACTGRGGGQLPPDNVFTGPASFGFSFSCENGELRIQLDYTDHGSNPIGSSFSIHGIVDQVDPVLESAVCIDQNPPPPPENQLIFLGRYLPDVIGAGRLPEHVPDARDGDHDVVPLRGHRAGQRRGLRSIAGRLLLYSAVDVDWHLYGSAGFQLLAAPRRVRVLRARGLPIEW